jgi:hypothetical protein
MRSLPIAIGAPDDALIINALIISTCVQIADPHAARACGKPSAVTANSQFDLQTASPKAL